jgi:hypothetical protein
MKFRTEIKPERSGLTIEPENRIVTLGSCFADNIAAKLIEHKFQIMQNPFGVIYNPVSIENSIKLTFDNWNFSGDDLIFSNGEYHSFYHHSSFSSENQDEILKKINSGISKTRDFILNADIAVITFGTVWVYRHKATNQIVSNCHKLPASEFTREKLSLDETVKSIARSVKYLRMMNPEIKVVLTVSPVRHWKDGAVENQRSKATLILAIEKILQECEGVFYFLSYEIVLDDLRDYRFYDEDLVHPNKLAVNYIWEKFSDTFFTDDTKIALHEISKVVAAAKHRIRNRNSEEARMFIHKTLNKIDGLERKYPHVDFSAEKKNLSMDFRLF